MKELNHNGHTWVAELAGWNSRASSRENTRVRFFCRESGQEAFANIPFNVDTFDTVPVSTLATALTEALAARPQRRG
jgi:hypothetical protein